MSTSKSLGKQSSLGGKSAHSRKDKEDRDLHPKVIKGEGILPPPEPPHLRQKGSSKLKRKRNIKLSKGGSGNSPLSKSVAMMLSAMLSAL